MTIDSFKHKGMRRQLVETLRKKGISSAPVLEAVGKVPRHLFLDTAFDKHAYEDKAFPIGSGQTISQPYTVAYQTELLQLEKRHKVLEVGTGSGYQASILLEIGAVVFTIERQKTLFHKTKALMNTMGYRPKMFFGDGYLGLPAFQPFDRIIVTAGAPFIPDPLVEQLKPGGIMVIPVGEGEIQVMTTLHKTREGETLVKTHGSFRFVPLLEDKARE